MCNCFTLKRVLSLLTLCLTFFALISSASNYPNKTIRLVVPFEPGGSSDITARIVASEMQKTLGQTIIVENLGGVGGSRGSEVVTKSSPDGYTLLWGNVAPIAINQHLYKNLNYDSQKNLIAISLATIFPNVLVVQPGLKSNTFASFMAQSKKEFSNLTYASAGNGSSTHLAGAWLNDLLGSKWLHVPFKGGGPALLAIASGQVDFYFSAIPSALPFIRAGKVFPLATTGKVRDPSLPNVPTIAEQGFPQFEVINWNGLFAPANTPPEIIQQLSKSMMDALVSPIVKEKLTAQGAIAMPMKPQEFSKFISEESIKWEKLVKLAHASIE
ncbi:Tripartite-type tricarboxylate transporter, receptor component TctC [Polynucleobacter kasalickyi]|uniref:Tripartite-type tricarboxylate transporter, receptor component TctC n=1 Tax=Polynucleobacter kasalickyi TaxID=1938817 RepID=A0A1W1Y9U6_9BURK|nr:Tripartite-type tricarboxylate transporter, receptor component TctC [Polynucleobacter kasalickyi]